MTGIRKLLSVFIMSLCLAQAAHASLVTVDPGTGTTTTFTGLNHAGAGPAVLNGITWNGSDVWAQTGYGMGSNGSWSWGMVATNSTAGSITASLDGAQGFVGAFMNYSPSNGTDPTIEALAADGTTVLETYNLVTSAPISTSGTNEGAFRGIQRAQNDIYYFRLSGSYIGVHTLETASVPEPATLVLVGAALLALAGARRRGGG